MLNDALKVFILEDLKTDQELIKRQVLKYQPNTTFTIANNRNSFLEKIEWLKPDVVLADYNLPDFNGLEALLYLKEKAPNVPFIFISATLNNEEYVAETIVQGADAFVSKNNLSSLPERLSKVIADAKERKAKFQDDINRINKQKLLLQKLEAKASRVQDAALQADLLAIIREIQSL